MVKMRTIGGLGIAYEVKTIIEETIHEVRIETRAQNEEGGTKEDTTIERGVKIETMTEAETTIGIGVRTETMTEEEIGTEAGVALHGNNVRNETCR